jgi:hypothetical protein
MADKAGDGIRWILAKAGQEPKGEIKKLAERAIVNLMKRKPEPKKQ